MSKLLQLAVVNEKTVDRVRSGSSIQTFGSYTVLSPANRTFQFNTEVMHTPDGGIRIMVANWRLTVTQEFKIVVAYAPTLTHNGVGLSYLPVTFEGQPTIVLPFATATLSTAGGNEAVAAIAYSDVIYPTPVARTDVAGAPTVLVFRVHGGAGVVPYRSFDDSVEAGLLCDYKVATAGSQSGDLTGGATGYTMTTVKGSRNIPEIGIEMSSPKSAKILVIGASQSAFPAYGFWSRATLKALNADHIRMYNCSIGTRSIGHQSASLRKIASAGVKPDIAIFWNCTINSLYNSAAQRKVQFDIVMADVLWCKDNGIKPVVMLRHSGAYDNVLVGLNDYRLLCIQDFDGICDVLDWGGLVNDPENPGAMLAKYNLDGIHVTDLAYKDFWRYAAPKLISWI